MIVVVGRTEDEGAQALVRRWGSLGAGLLTPRDLSCAGWAHQPESPSEGSAVVGGRPTPASEITGVVTTLETVAVSDVLHIVPADRAYVLTEMQAFLCAWLATIPCPVLNRPSPASLAGCGWQREEWALAAHALGIPTLPVKAGANGNGAGAAPEMTVTWVGTETLDAPSPRVAEWVRRLAEAAGAHALVARFRDGDQPRLHSVGTVPDFTREDVAIAARRWLEEPGP